MNKIKEIISQIVENKNNILFNLKQKDIDTYCCIKKRFENGSILDDLEFQSKFKIFYIMNSVGLSSEWKKRFFELLSDKQNNLEYILLELYKIPRLSKTYAVQFSFTTKLLHTINNKKPIYDKWVAIVINKKVSGSNKDEKIQSCIEIYKFLEKLYLKLIDNNKIKKVISEFRSKFNVDRKDISDVKVLDFIIWSLGKLKQDF